MARKLQVIVVGDTKDLERALGRAGKAGDTFGRRIQRGARIAGLALAGGLAVAAKVGFDELVAGQKVAAQTNAVLKSTGRVANVTAKGVDNLAQSLMKKSGIDDEVIASGENLLLTFRQIHNETGKGNDIFDQATVAALDLSVALGKDMNSAALMVGKALNDPLKGLTALGRAGVQFTAAQREQITAMVEAGDLMGAQKLILAELTAQVGGSAEAYGETLPGQIGKAKEAFADMSSSILVMFLPAMVALASGAQRITETMERHPTLARAITIGIIALTAALLAASIAQMALNLAVLANPYVAAAVAVIALSAAVYLLTTRVQFFRKHWQLLLAPLGLGVVVIATIIKAFVRWGGGIDNIVSKIQTLIGWVNAALGPLRTLIDLANKAGSIVPNFGGGAGRSGQPSGGGRGSQAPGSGGSSSGGTSGAAGSHQRAAVNVTYQSLFPPTEEQQRKAADFIANGLRTQGYRQSFRISPGV